MYTYKSGRICVCVCVYMRHNSPVPDSYVGVDFCLSHLLKNFQEYL